MSEINLGKLEEGARKAVVRGGLRGIEELLANAKKVLPATDAGDAPAKVKPVAKRGPSAKASAPKVAKKKAPSAARGSKRTEADLSAQAEKAYNVIQANGPIGVEGIAKATSLTTKELILPIRRLVTTGKVATKGQKRAMTYQIAA